LWTDEKLNTEVWSGNLKGRPQLGSLTHIWEDNIQIYLEETGYEDNN
jgi:hypothetical protein